MKRRIGTLLVAIAAYAFLIQPALAQFQVEWQLGAPGRGHPLDGVGGGPDVDFVQEDGVSNFPPGDPNSPAAHQQADDDYYFAGIYPSPISVVANDEVAMERAFVPSDNDLRIHFNLDGGTYNNASTFRFSFEPINLEQNNIPDPRYGIEIFFNGILIRPEQVIRPGDLNQVYVSPIMTLGDVNALYGPGQDNIIHLHGISYNNADGGRWMGMDYHALEINPVPEPSTVGLLIIGGLAGLVGLARRRRA